MLIEKYGKFNNELKDNDDLIKNLKNKQILLIIKYNNLNTAYKYKDWKIVSNKNLNMYKLQLIIRKKLHISNDKSIFIFQNKKLIKLNETLDKLIKNNKKFIDFEFSFNNCYGYRI